MSDECQAEVPGPLVVYRHPLPVRIFHWVNALVIAILLLSGLGIFNAHPYLHLGYTGYDDTPSILEISGNKDLRDPQGWVRVGAVRLDTTGLLGMPEKGGFSGTDIINTAFPARMTLPNAHDLGRQRGWHFLMAWIFAGNALAYIVYGFVTGRFGKEMKPTRKQLAWRAIARDIWMHMRLGHATGNDALSYNLLQKLAYTAVIFVLIPLMILTGMTMSNTAVAGFPWLLDLFGGRQTARTIHFLGAFSILLFLLIHIFQIFVAGFRREMRSIISGYYFVPRDDGR